MANRLDNLIPFTSDQNREKAKINGHKGGIASGEAKRKYKNLSAVLKDYADFKVTKKEQEQLEALGFTGEQSKMTLFALPLLKKMNQGDVKAIELFLKLTGQDSKLELENKKLREEIELLKVEQERLKQTAGINREIEDLTGLAEMLNDNQNAND